MRNKISPGNINLLEKNGKTISLFKKKLSAINSLWRIGNENRVESEDLITTMRKMITKRF